MSNITGILLIADIIAYKYTAHNALSKLIIPGSSFVVIILVATSDISDILIISCLDYNIYS